MKPRILIVEDDVNLGFLLVEYLESNGFEVKLYIDGVAGLNGFRMGIYDLCIIDIMLPRMDGFSLIKEIKLLDKQMSIIILSARSLKEDKLKGFDIGVDDYITKPFDEEELVCRIHAVLNRKQKPDPSKQTNLSKVSIGDYSFDPLNQVLSLNTNKYRLTFKENKILQLLSMSKNELVKRDEIMEQVWGDSNYSTGRSLDVFISKLRNYLKKDPKIKISTIPSVGYILEENTDTGS